MKGLPRSWTVLPACAHCNFKKGWYPFPAHVKGIRGVLSEPFTNFDGAILRYFKPSGPGRDIDRPRIVANVGAYLRHRFEQIQSITYFGKQRPEVEVILGNIACMALTGSRRELFPPPPRKLKSLFDLLRQSSDFNHLIQDRKFLGLIANPQIDSRLKPVAKAIQDYSRTHRLRVTA